MRKRLWQLLTVFMVAVLFAPLVQLGSASADRGYPDSTASGLSQTTGTTNDSSLNLSFTLVNTTAQDINYITFTAGADWHLLDCGDGFNGSSSCTWGGEEQPSFVLHPGNTLNQTVIVDLTDASSSAYSVGFYDSNTNMGWPTLEQQDFDFEVTSKDGVVPTGPPAGYGFCVYTATAPSTSSQEYYWKANIGLNNPTFEFIATSGTSFDDWLGGADISHIESVDSDSSGSAFLINAMTGIGHSAPEDSIETAPLSPGSYTGSFTMSNPDNSPVNFLWTDGLVGWYLDTPTVGSDCDTRVTASGPTLQVTAPAVNLAVSGTVTVSGTITEPDQIQDGQVVVHLRAVKSNGKLDGFLNTLYAPVAEDGTWSVTFNSTAFADGQYGVTALATDIAGNSQTAVGGASIKPFTIDNTKPTVSFTAPVNFASSYTAGPIVTISAADSGSGLAVMAIHVYNSSNQLLTTCGSATPAQLAAGVMSCDTSSLAPGTYSIKAGATDKAGHNQTVLSGNFTITG